MSNFLLYTHILISQKINFVTEVRFSQKRSHIKKNFKFLGGTVSEKSAMLISSYHRILLKNCAAEEHEIWFAYSILMG